MIKQTYKIMAAPEKVWQALTEPKIIEQWTGGKAQMSAEVGAKFKLWGGDIWGTNTQVVANKLLIQDWYGGKWPQPSKVKIELIAGSNHTQILLEHSELPPDEEKDFSHGWRDYYFGPMKKLLEEALS